MSGFTTHREVSEVPGGYRVWLTATLPAAGETIDLRSTAGWLACAWLGQGQPGQHTLVQAQESAVLKAMAILLPDTTTDNSYQVADDVAGIAGGPPDKAGRLNITWGIGARANTFYWKSNTGGDLTVYVELYFDVPVQPPT